MTIPKTVDDLTSEWLSDALGRKVVDPVIEPVGVGVGLVGNLYRVAFDDDAVIAKLAAPTDEGRFVASTLNFYGREVGFYTQLSPRTTIKHPRCFHAEHDPATHDTVLLLEDVGAHGAAGDQVQGCSLADARPALHTIARLHANFWDDPSLGELPFLLQLKDDPYPGAVGFAYDMSWPAVQEHFADMIDARVAEFGNRYSAMIPGLFASLCDGPLVLSHGDWRLDNLFFAGDEVIAVDWQIVDRSVGPRDVSYLVTQSLNIDDPQGYTTAFDAYLADLDDLGITVDRAWAWEKYLAGTVLGFVYPVVAGGGLVIEDPRHVELCRALFRRSLAALDALDAFDCNY